MSRLRSTRTDEGSGIILADPERRLVLAYVPAARRPAVAALWALDEALARIVATAREPALGQLRLAWWRDALERLDHAPPLGEPVLQALAATVLPAGVTGADMAPMTEGWDVLMPLDAVNEAALETHALERGARLFTLAGKLLGGAPPTEAGAIWARSDVARYLPGTGRGTSRRPVEEVATSDVARGEDPSTTRFASGPPSRAGEESRWPTALRPLGMLYILSLRDPAERPGSPARILRMLRHRLTGR